MFLLWSIFFTGTAYEKLAGAEDWEDEAVDLLLGVQSSEPRGGHVLGVKDGHQFWEKNYKTALSFNMFFNVFCL